MHVAGLGCIHNICLSGAFFTHIENMLYDFEGGKRTRVCSVHIKRIHVCILPFLVDYTKQAITKKAKPRTTTCVYMYMYVIYIYIYTHTLTHSDGYNRAVIAQ